MSNKSTAAALQFAHFLSSMATAEDTIGVIREALSSEGLSIFEDDPGVLSITFDAAGEATRVADSIAAPAGGNGPNVCVIVPIILYIYTSVYLT